MISCNQSLKLYPALLLITMMVIISSCCCMKMECYGDAFRLTGSSSLRSHHHCHRRRYLSVTCTNRGYNSNFFYPYYYSWNRKKYTNDCGHAVFANRNSRYTSSSSSSSSSLCMVLHSSNHNPSNSSSSSGGGSGSDNSNSGIKSISDKEKTIVSRSSTSQRELLLELENKLDYQGRISSKLLSSKQSKMNDNEINQRMDDDHKEMTTSSSSTATATAATTKSTLDIEHRCALITILGMPNMGKSTLLNALLSESLAIVTSRPQTTRHAILGVLSTPYTQLCVTDTPGIIDIPAYKLQQGMMEVVKGALRDADLFLVVTDIYSWGGGGTTSHYRDDDIVEDDKENYRNDKDTNTNGKMIETTMDCNNSLGIGEDILSKLRNSGKPVIVCVNKTDLASPKGVDGIIGGGSDEKLDSDTSAIRDNDTCNVHTTPSRAVQTIQQWRSVLPNAFAILPTCAANGSNDPGIEALRSILLANDPTVDVGQSIRNLGRPVPGMFVQDGMLPSNEQAREILPLGPPLYHPDFFTDRTDRFCASELIRETLFQSLGKELPYCCEVRIETFDESRRYYDDEGGTKETGRQQQQQQQSLSPKAMIRIGATILVERDSQKGIVVGKGGTKIKDVGITARKKLEEFYGVKVFLDLRVKVDKNWRNDADKLKKYGYM